MQAGVIFNLNGYKIETDTLAIDGNAYSAGEYAAGDLTPEVTDDPAAEGRIFVLGDRSGTLILLR